MPQSSALLLPHSPSINISLEKNSQASDNASLTTYRSMSHFLFLRKAAAVSSFWLRCARAFSFPMTFLGWLVIFIYSLQHGGKVLPGVLALVGAFAMHMATNLLDDLFDYFILRSNEELQKAALNDKCIYLINGSTSLPKMVMCILFSLGMAAGIGIFLIFLSGP